MSACISQPKSNAKTACAIPGSVFHLLADTGGDESSISDLRAIHVEVHEMVRPPMLISSLSLAMVEPYFFLFGCHARSRSLLALSSKAGCIASQRQMRPSDEIPPSYVVLPALIYLLWLLSLPSGACFHYCSLAMAAPSSAPASTSRVSCRPIISPVVYIPCLNKGY